MTATDIRVAKGLMQMSFILGQMTETIKRIENLVTSPQPQPPRPAAPGSTLHAPSSGVRA